MNSCLLSKQNGFSKFPPEKSALSRLGPGSFFPSLLPTPISIFYFFVFLRRISTGQEESHSPPPRVPKPLHIAGRRWGHTPPGPSPPTGQRNDLELDIEQHTGSKLGKEYVKAVYCHPAYLTYMLSTS